MNEHERGFSLIEVMVVSTIMAVISTVLILNFRESSVSNAAMNRSASIMVSDIRRAQSLATSLTLFEDNTVCGYGVHYINITSYTIYVGRISGGGTCASSSRNYQSSTDAVLETKKIITDKFELDKSFGDIFFEPPDPKTYINNDASLSQPAETVVIIEKGGTNCNQFKCIFIDIFPSGRVDIRNE